MAISGTIALGRDENGNIQLVGLTNSGLTTDNGLIIWQLAVDSAVTIDPGTITIGAVKVQNAADATEAKVAASTAIAIANNVLGTHDPQVGQVGDTVANGTVIGLLDHIAQPNLTLGIAGIAFTSANASAAPAAVTGAPAAGEFMHVAKIVVSTDTANMTVDFTEETSGDLKLRLYMSNNGFVTIIGQDLVLAVADKRLMVQTNKSGNIAVTTWWHSVP